MPKQRPSMQSRMVETQRTTARTDTLLMGRERDRREVVELLIREVMPNRQQPRTHFARESLDELAESIRLHGVLEPIIVRAIPLTFHEGSGRQYELIAGERRWRAAALAARETIAALVFPESTSDQMALELAITENLQREDLHPIDEAVAFGRMQRDLGYSYAQIAERLGKSKGYVQNRMRLLQLDEDLQQLVAERPDTLTHVYELAKVADPEQRSALIAAVRTDSLSFAETRARVQALLSPPPGPPREEESYLRKTDRAPHHDDRPEGGAPTASEAYLYKYDGAPDAPHDDESYLRKTDRAPHHDDLPADREPAASEAYLYKYDGAPDAAQSLVQPTAASASLSPRERAALATATAKVERYLADPTLLSEEDWAVLAPLALRLSDLLRQVGHAQDAARTTDVPDR